MHTLKGGYFSVNQVAMQLNRASSISIIEYSVLAIVGLNKFCSNIDKKKGSNQLPFFVVPKLLIPVFNLVNFRFLNIQYFM